MLYRTLAVTSVAAMLICWSPEIARAQFGGYGGGIMAGPAQEVISGTGSVVLKRSATRMRMYVELSGKAETLEEALAKLEQRRQAAVTQLETLRADTKSVTLGKPTLSNPQTAQRRQFEQMVIERMGSRVKEVPKGLKVPKTVIVSMRLSAEWPLDAASPEQLLLATEALKEKVTAADLAGTKQTEELSPEEAELAEEMAAMMSDQGEEQVPVGKPHFVYVARISEADRDRAMAEAFGKAKLQAGQLARAAGIGLGPLVGISGAGGGQSSYGNDSSYLSYGYARQEYLGRLVGMEATSGMAEAPGEAVATDPSELVFRFHVGANFRLEK